MELELRQEYISCWDRGYRTCINREETTEMIVPDACPDILQILDGEGTLLLQRRECLEGRIELSGCIRVAILYQADGTEGVCAMETPLPFSVNQDMANLTSQSKLMVTPCVQKVDVHVLNPRKVLIKVNFRLDVCCYTPQRMAVCACAEQPEAYGLRQKTEERNSHLTMAVHEKSFNYTDVLTLPAGNPDLAALLRVRADCLSQDAKVIGNKLLFKGEARVEALYRSTEDRLCSVAFPLPFSQMMEIAEGSEDSVPELRLLVTDLACKPADGDGRALSVELELVAQCALSGTQKLNLLRDLYSTTHLCTETRKTYPLCRMMDHGSAPESVREFLESTQPVETVLDVQLRPIELQLSREGESLSMQADVDAFVLYRAEGGMTDSLHRRLRVTHAIPVAGTWEYDCDVRVARQATAMPNGSGVELSFSLDFLWNAMENSAVEGIEHVNLEERAKSDQPLPTVIIRSVRDGETLWDLAKRYATSEAEIAEANALPTMELLSGQMLMIPR